MAQADQRKWDHIYTDNDKDTGKPCRVLSSHYHLLPPTGDALDLACGRGANALFLAARGYATRAWDISGVALERLADRARRLGLPLKTEQRDVTASPPQPASFDIIVVSRFLDRTLAPAICAALRERGLLFYQTFIRENVSDFGPHNPDYRLRANELLHLFQSLHVIYYHEEGTTGNTERGFRDEAMLIAQKR